MTVGILLALSFLFLSAVFSGSETGVYSISRVRLEADVHARRRAASLLERLSRNESVFLITLLIGNNLMLEMLTHEVESGLLPHDLPAGTTELVVTLTLTPVVFLFGELLPKDLFRRRPHRFLYLSVPVLSVARVLFLPLALPVYGISRLLERVFGLRRRAVARALGREEMIEVFEEGARTGALAPQAQPLVRNVLVLRETPVQRVMVPWDRVRHVPLGRTDEEVRAAVEDAEFTRQPALDEHGHVTGYLNQLEVLSDPGPPAAHVRELERFAPETPVDRALARLRSSGQRLALVGTPEEPRGLVTLMDLVAEISRESREA